jgi:hypothetical protein
MAGLMSSKPGPFARLSAAEPSSLDVPQAVPLERADSTVGYAVGPGCSHWYLTQNEHETYRVVDLNGQRAVVAVAHIDESINPELMREARAVFDSFVFKSHK